MNHKGIGPNMELEEEYYMSDGITDMRSQPDYVCSNCNFKGTENYFYKDYSDNPMICMECYRKNKNKINKKNNKIKVSDPVNHPSHYIAYKGVEIIQLTEQMNFNRGNAVKYICRAGLKNKDKEVEDLQKAVWYINREIERLGK